MWIEELILVGTQITILKYILLVWLGYAIKYWILSISGKINIDNLHRQFI